MAPGDGFKSSNILEEVVISTSKGKNNYKPSVDNDKSSIDKIGIVNGAFGVAQGAQENIIGLAPELKSLRYVKGLKVVGKLSFGVQVGVSLVNVGKAFYDHDSNKWGVLGKGGLDVAIGAVAVWGGPVGWAIGGVYFIGDAAGWWGDWGTEKDKH